MIDGTCSVAALEILLRQGQAPSLRKRSAITRTRSSSSSCNQGPKPRQWPLEFAGPAGAPLRAGAKTPMLHPLFSSGANPGVAAKPRTIGVLAPGEAVTTGTRQEGRCGRDGPGYQKIPFGRPRALLLRPAGLFLPSPTLARLQLTKMRGFLEKPFAALAVVLTGPVGGSDG